MDKRPQRVRRLAWWAALLGLWFPSATESASLTVAWDRNPEPGVIGYRVYVGTEAGQYSNVYDVGAQTTFMFLGAIEGERYFFSVAAYSPGPRLGPLSEEVSAVAGSMSGLAVPMEEWVACPAVEPDGCVTARLVADELGMVSSLAATGDGRLLFIEDDRRIRLVAGGALMPEPALEESSVATRLIRVVVDPSFGRTGFVFVGLATTQAEGARDLSIVRYRMAGNRLGEGARIISDMPIPLAGDVKFAVDASGRLYLAIPGEDRSSPQRNPYAGFILHFNPDGSVPRESRHGSPILAHGYARPTGLEWDAEGRRLWLSGADARWPFPIASVDVGGTEPAEWPRVPRSLYGTSGADGRLPARVDAILVRQRNDPQASMTMFVLGEGRLTRATFGPPTDVRPMSVAASNMFGPPRAMAFASQRDLYVVIARDTVTGRRNPHAILRISVAR